MSQWNVSSRVVLAVAAVLTVLIMVACQPSAPSSESAVPPAATPASATESPGLTPEAPVDVAPTPAPPTGNEEEGRATPASTTPAGDPTPGNPEADGVVALAQANLAQRLGVVGEEIVVRSLEAVQWPDTSLGCPQPGMMYAQVITPGYRLVLETAGATYRYHADQDKTVVLCESLPSPGTPSKGIDTTVDDGWPNQPLGDDVIIEPPADRKP